MSMSRLLLFISFFHTSSPSLQVTSPIREIIHPATCALGHSLPERSTRPPREPCPTFHRIRFTTYRVVETLHYSNYICHCKRSTACTRRLRSEHTSTATNPLIASTIPISTWVASKLGTLTPGPRAAP
jgi:hypothetical protein